MIGSAPFFRDDTLFGVCQALGEDFGFNPNIVRALIGAGLLFSPLMTVAVYGVAAVLVTISRFLVPDLPANPPLFEQAPERSSNENEFEPQLPLAA